MKITNNYAQNNFKSNSNINFKGVKVDQKLIDTLKANIHHFSGDEVVKITDLIKRLDNIDIADGIIHYGQEAPHVNTPSKMFAELRDDKFRQIYHYTLKQIEPEKTRDPRLRGPVEFAKTLFQSEKTYRNGSIAGSMEEGINFLKKHFEDAVVRIEKIYTQVAQDEAAKADINKVI